MKFGTYLSSKCSARAHCNVAQNLLGYTLEQVYNTFEFNDSYAQFLRRLYKVLTEMAARLPVCPQ